ncbi:30S ribosomal protein S6e [Candidatus Woesearchaeota archaeon]|nr:30S ribosomal protein S6e [Candidatus Woesearchaeota archaeon]
MTEVKFVVNDTKTGKSYQKVLEENPYLNKKIGDKVTGSEIGLNGYELEIKGGSDKSGCPIRYDMPGFGKKKALLSSGPCVKGLKKGKRIKKTVVGNIINQDIVQVNLKVLKEGSQKLEELFPKKEEAKAAA